MLNQIGDFFLNMVVFGVMGALIYRTLKINELENQKKVKKQAFTDQLTGSGNRHLFLSTMDKLLNTNKKFAICFMDLDGFKQINDTMGHDAGDALLISLARIFKEKLPKNAVAYRLGGDEFAIIIQNVKTTEDISILLDNLKKEFSVPILIEDSSVTLEYSLGVAMYPEDATNKKDLIMYADDAMYHIKEHGKNDYYFHNKALKAKLDNKTKMEKDLKTAYEKDQFGFCLQPRIDIKDYNKVCFEALLYWKHPVLGKINSEYFIKQADEMGLTIKLDQYVLRNVCRILLELNKKGFKNIEMAINISNRHSARKDFIDELCSILNEYDFKKGTLKIEITDNIDIKKIEDYKVMFEKFKNCGVDIIINNLEIRQDNLALFSELPIDELKISSKYIYDDNENSIEIFKDIIKLGLDMKYKVIIGQLETSKELDIAIASGANKLQGDVLFKKIEEFYAEEFLNSYADYRKNIDNIITNAKQLNKLL
jgi:diguanylate cyclase (GGDEF)-like protein